MYTKKILEDGTKVLDIPGAGSRVIGFETIKENESFSLAFHPSALGRVPDSGHITAWLLNGNSVPVGNIAYNFRPELEIGDTNRLVLDSIEVRDAYRGQGFAKFMVECVMEFLGEQMYCTGCYTPSGFESLNGLLPVVFADRFNNFGAGVVEFDDMTFVEDWDLLIPKYL